MRSFVGVWRETGALATLGPDADAVFALLQRAGWDSLRVASS